MKSARRGHPSEHCGAQFARGFARDSGCGPDPESGFEPGRRAGPQAIERGAVAQAPQAFIAPLVVSKGKPDHLKSIRRRSLWMEAVTSSHGGPGTGRYQTGNKPVASRSAPNTCTGETSSRRTALLDPRERCFRTTPSTSGQRRSCRPTFLEQDMSILLMMQDWWRLRKAAGALQSMDDWTLRDIGIAREEIPHAVRFGRERQQVAAEYRPALDAGPEAGYKRTTKRRATEVFQIPVS